jgi:hypothetical protein
VVKPLTKREEREFVPLKGFDQIFEDNARGKLPQPSREYRDISVALSSSSIEEPNTPRSVKKSFQKLLKVAQSPTDLAERVQKIERRITRLEDATVPRFEELILKDSLLAKVNRVRNEYTNTNRSRRQITKAKVLTTKDANSRIAIRSEEENQQWVRRVRRENAKQRAEKLAKEERIDELRKKALAGSEVDRLFEPFDLFFEDTEGDSSLRV